MEWPFQGMDADADRGLANSLGSDLQSFDVIWIETTGVGELAERGS